jgi:hypothetical protein
MNQAVFRSLRPLEMTIEKKILARLNRFFQLEEPFYGLNQLFEFILKRPNASIALLSEYVSTRSNLVTEGFVNQRSLSHHSVVVQISNWLAWIHQAIANENEFYELLFSEYEDSIGCSKKIVLGRIFSSLGQKLCRRMEVIYTAELSCPQLFNVLYILKYYMEKYSQRLGPVEEESLISALEDIAKKTNRTIDLLINEISSLLLESLPEGIDFYALELAGHHFETYLSTIVQTPSLALPNEN